MFHIPVIDFEACAVGKELPDIETCKNLGKNIYEAFATIGFVYLKNTGIKNDEVDAINSISADFFKLDAFVKQKYKRNPHNHGYVGPGDESINPERPGDYKEAYGVSFTGTAHGNLLWPDEYVPGFSAQMKQFCDRCRQLSEQLLRVLSLGMEIKDPDFFEKCHSRMNGQDNFTTLRSLFYPPVPESYQIKPGQLRLGEHSDYGSFTLLFQDTVGGLQVESFSGEYKEAVPIPETVLVNIGDILQYWTDGRLKSTRHRVLMPDHQSGRNVNRRSLAYFVHPNHEVILSGIEYAASGETTTGTIPKHAEPITAFEHVTRRFKDSYGY